MTKKAASRMHIRTHLHSRTHNFAMLCFLFLLKGKCFQCFSEIPFQRYSGHVMPFHTLSEPALRSYSAGQCCGRQLGKTPGFCHCIHHNDLETWRENFGCCELLIGLCSALLSTVPERGHSMSQNFCDYEKYI